MCKNSHYVHRKRIHGRVVGNKKSIERERWNDDVGNGRRRPKERENQEEKQRERGRSSGRGVKGVITPAGWVAEERARVDGWRPRGW